jgi:hypothetical protein
MRKASLIIGYISFFLLLFGSILKWLHIPGGSGPVLLGSLLLEIYLALLLIYNMNRKETPGLLKAAQVVGLFAGWGFSAGYLFTIQSWPGAQAQLITGIALVLIFLIFYTVSIISWKTEQRKINHFTLLSTMQFLLLLIGLVSITPTSVIREGYIRQEQAMIKPLKDAYDRAPGLYIQLTAVWSEKSNMFMQDNDHNRSLKSRSKAIMDSAAQLEFSTKGLIEYLHQVRSDLIRHVTFLPGDRYDTISLKSVPRITDYDTPTHYLIGSDPSNPIGRSVELKQKLEIYQNMLLALVQTKAFNTGLETGEVVDSEGKTHPWIIANFYRVELGKVMLIFKALELRIKDAEALTLQELIRQGNEVK